MAARAAISQFDALLLGLQLETLATAGVVVVVAVLGIIMYEAIKAGLPGITSGELPLWSLKACAAL